MTSLMKITMRFFASYREITGLAITTLDLEKAADVARLKALLSQKYPALAAAFPHALIAVNEMYASDETPLKDGDTVALFPPVSGG